MDLEQLKTLLGENENAEAIIEAFGNTNAELADVKSKKGAGIKTKDKLTKLTNAFTELGFDGDTDVMDFVQQIKTKQSKMSTSQVEKGALEEKIEAMELKWEKAEQKATRLQKESYADKMATKLTAALADKLYAPNYVIESLIANGKVDIVDNEVVFKDGDDYMSFDKGIDGVLEANKDILKINQKSGSNDTSNQHSESKNLEGMSVKEVMNNMDKIAAEMGVEI